MIRALVGGVGAVTALFPATIVAGFETLVSAAPGDNTRRAGVARVSRSKGALVAVIALLGGRAYAWLVTLTGAFGAVLLVAPHPYRELATTLCSERPDDVEWTEG